MQRWSHVLMQYTGGVGNVATIPLPSIEGVVVEIGELRLSYEGVIGSGGVIHIFGHNLGAGLVGAQLEDAKNWASFLMDHDAALTPPQYLPQIFVPAIDVAGPQRWIAEEGGLTSAVFLATIRYTTRKISLLEWAGLRDRTSYNRNP